MAGQSRRFFDAGYRSPKYMLPLQGKTLFDWSILSFQRYFDNEQFLFVVREDEQTVNFVANHCKQMSIKRFAIKQLKRDTRGQAETVALALESVSNNEPMLIFNIDTIRPDYMYPTNQGDGFIEVFQAEGNQWSFVEPKDDILVQRTTEKERISDFCSSGIYGFKNAGIFMEAFNAEIFKANWQSNELYVAPLYNNLINAGYKITYYSVSPEKVICSGTPAEYEQLLNSNLVLS